ncbi:lysophospholipase L1-like esterase [Mucilaginibacter sp. UYNi724]
MKTKICLLFVMMLVAVSCAKNDGLADGKAIVAWGDSLTFGVKGGESYPKELQRLTGIRIINKGVSGAKSNTIAAEMVKSSDLYQYPIIIWVGRNNFRYPEQVKADIALMISKLKHQHYLVLSILNKNTPDELKGGKSYAILAGLNNYLDETYGNHFVDVRSYLIGSYNTGSSSDLMSYDADVAPASLRIDDLHLNAKGYDLVAQKVYEKFDILTK